MSDAYDDLFADDSGGEDELDAAKAIVSCSSSLSPILLLSPFSLSLSLPPSLLRRTLVSMFINLS